MVTPFSFSWRIAISFSFPTLFGVERMRACLPEMTRVATTESHRSPFRPFSRCPVLNIAGNDNISFLCARGYFR